MNEFYYLLKIKSGWKWEYTFATTDSEKALKLAKDLMIMHVEDVDYKGEPMEFVVSIKLIENDKIVDLFESEDNL